MSEKIFHIVSVGEVLWDVLPTGRRLGGAPANFAYISTQLGNTARVLSRVGNDPLGAAIIDEMIAKGLSTADLQIDNLHQTGVVNVGLVDGQPDYEIVEAVAWDFLEVSDDWLAVCMDADAICFGTLAQRVDTSRTAIRSLVRASRRDALRIFDVNLREPFYSREVLFESFEIANVVKLNHDELLLVSEMFGVNGGDDAYVATRIRDKFGLIALCVTRGERGSLILSGDEVSDLPGLSVAVADTIGAGDSFTAAFTNGLLRRWPLDEINEKANRIASMVASRSGGMPDLGPI